MENFLRGKNGGPPHGWAGQDQIRGRYRYPTYPTHFTLLRFIIGKEAGAYTLLGLLVQGLVFSLSHLLLLRLRAGLVGFAIRDRNLASVASWTG